MAGVLPRSVCHTTSSICSSCHLRLSGRPRNARFLATTRSDSYSPNDGMDLINATLRRVSKSNTSAQANRPAAVLDRAPTPTSSLARLAETARYEAQNKPSTLASLDEPHHINVYAHKHNTHITFTDPNRNPILSLSAGDIGLKKAARGTYDASYQLAVYAFAKMMEKQWRLGGKKSKTNTQTMRDVEKIEVLLRGYGPGREAFQKAILGAEGRLIKHKVVRVADGTRLKFGGCRSRQVRRL